MSEVEVDRVRAWDGAAIVSCLLGIATVLTAFTLVGLPLGVGAIVAAIIARRRLRANPELRGWGASLSGVVLGTVGLVGGLFTPASIVLFLIGGRVG